MGWPNLILRTGCDLAWCPKETKAQLQEEAEDEEAEEEDEEDEDQGIGLELKLPNDLNEARQNENWSNVCIKG